MSQKIELKKYIYTHIGCISDTKKTLTQKDTVCLYVRMQTICHCCVAGCCCAFGISVMTGFYIPSGLHDRGCLYGLMSGESWELSGERRSVRG